ncbi:MAG: MgtC/SapB family protein [Nitrospirae bacterium]|nr:MgtC/SapB family protein [Nitrospirota bacterium]
MTAIRSLDYNDIYMITTQETILRLLIGAVIGGVIGFEREIHGRAAGFRTQLIVCVASVLIMIVSENYHLRLQNIEPTFRIDPARLASGALIGIGFLGAGVIVKSGFAIRGLTTAASIWIVSAIGLAIGGGFYVEGITTAFITIFALFFLRKIEKNIKILLYRSITISTLFTENIEETLTAIFSDYDVKVQSIDYEKNQATGEFIYNFQVSTRNKGAIKEIFLKLNTLDFIKKININSYRIGDTY